MTYEEAISFIHDRVGIGKKVGLENISKLLARLGNPQNAFESIHVAGTNGKGSTCAFLESVLRQAGKNVGMYISPYLMRYNERIQINGKPIDDLELARIAEIVRPHVQAMEAEEDGVATFFEVGTAVAFMAFKEAGVRYAVVETGLGGRMDSTNVIEPMACAIAKIGFDHVAILGDTLEKIAFEKAGIAKKGIPLVLQAQGGDVVRTIEEVCAEKGAPFIDMAAYPAADVRLSPRGAVFTPQIPGLSGEVEIGMAGRHQVENAMTALGVLAALKERLGLSMEDIKIGMRNAFWPGRAEWFGNLLLDGAHNPQGARAIVSYIQENFPGEKLTLLFGIMADKAVGEYIEILRPIAGRVVCVRPENIPRAIDPNVLKEAFEREGIEAIAVQSTGEGLFAAKHLANDEGIVLVCGSLYLVGEVRAMLV